MMQQTIQRLIQEAPYKVHMFVKDFKTNDFVIHERLDDAFSSASLIKVPILIAVFDYIDVCNIPINQVITVTPSDWVDFSVISEQRVTSCTIYELCVWMITTSDNTATNVLIDLIGMDVLNQYFHKIGLTQTQLQRKMMDFERLAKGIDNITTARDMALLFSRIYEKNLLSPVFSQLVIDILCRQRFHENLRRYIVDDVTIAHKTGGLDSVDHDVGIVYSHGQEYAIGVFITEVKQNDVARQLIGRLSKVVYDNMIVVKGEAT
ncbi:serine hydrolase [Lysinibacillus sp. FSL M8-0337]|uniref:serine hydrolase n=1 Tax=Lysinibacillus TaxID=400634 RepID=UPI000A6B999A|nr:serine hydrolase [Lysinibacillus sphaericus]